jgi:hypothetical protein
MDKARDGTNRKGRTVTIPCSATRLDGRPCQAKALTTGPYCWAHAPELAEKRLGVGAVGSNSSKSARLRALVPLRLLAVYDRLELALEEVHTGRLEPRQAQAMAAIAGAMVRVLTAGELEERVRALEGRHQP